MAASPLPSAPSSPDFLRSLSPSSDDFPSPSVATWWATTNLNGKTPAHVTLGPQFLDESYSLGSSLSEHDLLPLVFRIAPTTDVATRSILKPWVGNSFSQCPGECAWLFYQPWYGPKTPPLIPPNGDIGMDGAVANLATLLAATGTGTSRATPRCR